MALSKYIRDLLFRYECVIVPDLGGFLTKTVSAQIDERTHTLSPPSKRLGFNSQLTENDGLLANYIASVDKVPYETAINFIALEVESWRKKLINQDVTLEEVGAFSLNKEKKLIFEPDPNANFLTDSFGLAKVVAPAVFREDYMNEEVIFDSISDVLSEEEIYINAGVIKRRIGPLLKYAATFAILLTIGYFLGNQIIKNNKLRKEVAESEENEESKLNKRIQEATFEINKTLPAITIQVKKEQNMDVEENVADNADGINSELEANQEENAVVSQDEAVRNSEATIETPEEAIISETTSTITSDTKFHIIAGAFREPANATKKLTQLKDQGYDAQIVGMNKWQLTQVAFGSFATREEAQTALNDIRKTVAKDAWLLVK